MNLLRFARVSVWPVFVVLCVLGCASSNRTERERFHIETTPESATATLSTGQQCITPCYFDMPRAEDFRVTITKDGYKAVTKTIESVKSKAGGKPVSASVSMGGLLNIPVGPQADTSYDLEPNPLVVELEVRRR